MTNSHPNKGGRAGPGAPWINGSATTFVSGLLNETGGELVAADENRVGIAYVRNEGAVTAALGNDISDCDSEVAQKGSSRKHWQIWLGKGSIYGRGIGGSTVFSGWYI